MSLFELKDEEIRNLIYDLVEKRMGLTYQDPYWGVSYFILNDDEILIKILDYHEAQVFVKKETPLGFVVFTIKAKYQGKKLVPIEVS